MSTITLYRKPDFMLMARSFKIHIDDRLITEIEVGENKTIEVPTDSRELTVHIMNYKSRPIVLNPGKNETYIIKQNLLSNILTYCMMLLAAIYFIAKFVGETDLPYVLYAAIPFVASSIYYSTLGRRQVILLRKKED